MVKAGFTPFQIYQSGSINVARYFGVENEVGTVAAGRRADLVLLDANPLENVSNWGKRAGVMVRGKWYDAAEIQRRLEELSKS
jgi:adenine deaminase